MSCSDGYTPCRTTIPPTARVERAGSWKPRRPNQERIDAAVSAYRRHVEPTDDELDRLEAVMYIRTLYLACFGYRRAITNGQAFNEWGFIRPREYFSATAGATRAAFGR